MEMIFKFAFKREEPALTKQERKKNNRKKMKMSCDYMVAISF
jgi:hypothetical protein